MIHLGPSWALGQSQTERNEPDRYESFNFGQDGLMGTTALQDLPPSVLPHLVYPIEYVVDPLHAAAPPICSLRLLAAPSRRAVPITQQKPSRSSTFLPSTSIFAKYQESKDTKQTRIIMPSPSSDLESQRAHFVAAGLTELSAASTLTFIPSSRLDFSQLPAGASAVVSRDTFFRALLNSEEGVPYMLGFCADPFHAAEAQKDFPPLPFVTASATLALDLRGGARGVNGSLHGGLAAALLDEALGSLRFQNHLLNRAAKARGSVAPDAADVAPAATTRMDIRYRRPFPVPDVAVVTASLERVEGRRLQMRAVLRDRQGKEYATCDGTFVSLAQAKL
ncbi:HotDog domain-containing protein [Xylariomycetidae sp. FL0641]|nr:HotDog domain-containing protein [Xylariomycetidae sp. FL0641]